METTCVDLFYITNVIFVLAIFIYFIFKVSVKFFNCRFVHADLQLLNSLHLMGKNQKLFLFPQKTFKKRWEN